MSTEQDGRANPEKPIRAYIRDIDADALRNPQGVRAFNVKAFLLFLASDHEKSTRSLKTWLAVTGLSEDTFYKYRDACECLGLISVAPVPGGQGATVLRLRHESIKGLPAIQQSSIRHSVPVPRTKFAKVQTSDPAPEHTPWFTQFTHDLAGELGLDDLPTAALQKAWSPIYDHIGNEEVFNDVVAVFMDTRFWPANDNGDCRNPVGYLLSVFPEWFLDDGESRIDEARQRASRAAERERADAERERREAEPDGERQRKQWLAERLKDQELMGDIWQHQGADPSPQVAAALLPLWAESIRSRAATLEVVHANFDDAMAAAWESVETASDAAKLITQALDRRAQSLAEEQQALAERTAEAEQGFEALHRDFLDLKEEASAAAERIDEERRRWGPRDPHTIANLQHESRQRTAAWVRFREEVWQPAWELLYDAWGPDELDRRIATVNKAYYAELAS